MDRDTLLAAAAALDGYRTASGSPREGFEAAARVLREAARTGRFPAHGTLERRPEDGNCSG